MILMVFAVRDRATDQFATPLFLVSIGQAIRSFSDEINNTNKDNNYLNKHADDYDLYQLGTFNTDTGLFDVGSPRQIAVGKDLLVSSK